MIHVGEIMFHRSSFGSTYVVWGYPPIDSNDEYVLWEARHAWQERYGRGASFRKLGEVVKALEEYPEVLK